MQIDAPEIRDLKRSQFEIFVEIMAATVMLGTWVVAIYQYRLTRQPEVGIFVMPAVSTLIYFAILGAWCLSPRYYNLWAQVTEENARRLYGQARRLICLVHLLVVIFFAFITWES